MRMKSALLGLLCLAAAGEAQAQVQYDMSKATCKDYELMSPEAKRDFGAWMSGWFNGKSGRTEVNQQVYEANSASVRQWCASNPTAQIMPMLEGAVRNAKPVQGGATSIDAAAITCGDFVGYIQDSQLLVSAWTAGYVASTKNVTKLDFKNFSRQEKAVLASCKKNKKQKLLAVVEKSWK